MKISTAIDFVIFPASVVSALVVAWWMLRSGVPNFWVTPIVVAPYVALVWLLEIYRPERPTLARDYSLVREACHFVFNFEIGYGSALLVLWILERPLRLVLPRYWPEHWSIWLQMLLAVFLYEGTSYWQHRLVHRRLRWWPFHALHHSGQRLDFFRACRFHAIDFVTVAFVAFLPLMVLGVPEDIITMMAVLVSILGLMHHGNIRLRTPSWLDILICTPAVHRRHHSVVWQESNANFGNTLMIFDFLFGTYAKPDPVGPKAMGIENDELPMQGFWAQTLGPVRDFFRPSPGSISHQSCANPWEDATASRSRTL